jgi:hypothetical protein
VTTPATILVGGQPLTPAMRRTMTDLIRFGRAVRANPYRPSDWTWRINDKPCSNSIDRLLSAGWAEFERGNRDVVVITRAGRTVLKERGAAR